jgi:hypothetical protein
VCRAGGLGSELTDVVASKVAPLSRSPLARAEHGLASRVAGAPGGRGHRHAVFDQALRANMRAASTDAGARVLPGLLQLIALRILPLLCSALGAIFCPSRLQISALPVLLQNHLHNPGVEQTQARCVAEARVLAHGKRHAAHAAPLNPCLCLLEEV